MKKHIISAPVRILRPLLLVLFCFHSAAIMAKLPGDVPKSKVVIKRSSIKKRTVQRRTVATSDNVPEVFVINTCTNPTTPARPNNGLIVVCSPNEHVSLTSETNFPAYPDPCWFHCGLLWSAPANWQFIVDPGGPGERGPNNPIYGTLGAASTCSTCSPMALVAPGSVSHGLVGTVTLLAEYSDCNADHNTSSSATLWFGYPNVTGATVNEHLPNHLILSMDQLS